MLNFLYKDSQDQPTCINLKDIYQDKGQKQHLTILLAGSCFQDFKTGRSSKIKCYHYWIPFTPKQLRNELSKDVEHKIAFDLIHSAVLPYLMKGRFSPTTTFKLSKGEEVKAISNDRKRIVTASRSCPCIKSILDSEDFVCLADMENFNALTTVLSPDGTQLVIGELKKKLSLWDAATGKKVKDLKEGIFVRNIVFNESGSLLAVASQKIAEGPGYEVEVWNTEKWERICHFDIDGLPNSVAFCPGRKIVACVYGKKLKVWNTETRKLLHTCTNHGINHIAFSPDGKLGASCDKMGKVLLWDVGTGKVQKIIDVLAEAGELTFAQEGKNLLAVHQLSNDEIVLCDFQSGKEQKRLAHAIFVESMSFSNDAKKVYALGAGGLNQWDLEADPIGDWLQHEIDIPEAMIVEKAYKLKIADKSLVIKQGTNEHKTFLQLRKEKPLIADFLIKKLLIKLEE